MMPKLGGAGQRKRRLLDTVVESKILYSLPIWVEALVHQRNIETILRHQRILTLRTAMLYRTVSTAAVMVVTSIVSAHLLA
jgi:hypothetical protein